MKLYRDTFKYAGLALAIGGVSLATQTTFAASKLYSSVKTIEATSSVEPTIQKSDVVGKTGGVVSSSVAATSVFNISISLEENPLGDDDYTADPGTDDDAQNKFEKKIEEFADAVYQMTNGAHSIGKVTVFRNGDQANNADVQWKKDCSSDEGPRANISGFGVPGARIWMCTTWTGAPALMDTPKGAGFTLAHEWGHYTYGIFDEYTANCGKAPESSCFIGQPRSTDTPSSPSIMNNQWNAAASGGNQDWLEVSTLGVQPYSSDPTGNDENAQARVFGEPGWSTLTRSPATDPKYSWLNRTQYSNLTAPSGSDLTVNDDESSARDQLEIIWAGNQAVELMIDTSGSMSGTPIVNAKAAADLLVGQLTPGESAIGVGRFSGSALQVYPITDIPDPDTTVIPAAQAAIAGLFASGGTDIQEAALTGLAQTQAFEGGSRPSVVFLLTDGQSFVDVNTVVNAYNAANVPLITFGFGSNVDTTLLQSLATGTGGQYFFSPTSLASIQQAFVAANAAVSSSIVVNSGTEVSLDNSTSIRSIEVDGTMAKAIFNATYTGSVGDVDLRLLDPSGADTGLSFECNGTFEVSCSADIDTNVFGNGTYGVEVTNNTGSDIDVALLVSGTPSEFESYELALEFGSINYPESFSIFATVTKGAAIAGLDVVADVTDPSGTTQQIVLLDDGMNSDEIAGDGIYSAAVPYASGFLGNGSYTAIVTASNESGNGVTTYENVAIALGEDGSSIVPEAENITENFSRTGVATASVSNSQFDDHVDDTSGLGCTNIFDDNLDTVGRIDAAGDIDCFQFAPTDTTSNLVIRLTALTSGMSPVLKVFDTTGTTEILSANIDDTENDASGLIVTIPSSSLDGLGHVVSVEHADSTKVEGGYEISVGASLVSDTPPVENEGEVLGEEETRDSSSSDGGGGGALTPWFILGILTLALLGKARTYRRTS